MNDDIKEFIEGCVIFASLAVICLGVLIIG